jgi:hypothetical protein
MSCWLALLSWTSLLQEALMPFSRAWQHHENMSIWFRQKSTVNTCCLFRYISPTADNMSDMFIIHLT